MNAELEEALELSLDEGEPRSRCLSVPSASFREGLHEFHGILKLHVLKEAIVFVRGTDPKDIEKVWEVLGEVEYRLKLLDDSLEASNEQHGKLLESVNAVGFEVTEMIA